MAPSGAVDHSYEVRNVGKTRIVDLEYTYGDVGVRTMRLLGVGGDGRTEVMPVPANVTFKWTTAEDNKRHEVFIPLASLVGNVTRRKVTFDIDKAELHLYVDYIHPTSFERERRFIQSFRTP